MTPEQITAWAAAGESETQEFKETTGQRRAGARGVCAMLNHRGGRVMFGVNPAGVVIGQRVGKDTQEDIAQELQNLDPPAFPSIDRVAVGEGREVIVVTVAPGASPPYSFGGVAYRRVGSTNQRLSREEYNRILLERVHGQTRWENEEAPGWSVADLDEEQIVATVDEAVRRGRLEEPGTRAPGTLLRGLRLLRGDCLLRAAVVLFGRSDRMADAYPQCLLRVARFRGVTRTDFLDNRQFRGNAFDLFRAAQRFLVESLPIAGRVLPDLFERVDDPLYPPEALREAVANAICHRDYALGGGSIGIGIYDDRLEVTSTGALHFGLTPEILFQLHESRPWNPLIADAFYRRGIIENWGRGILRMAELTQQAGLPRPEIEDTGGAVTVRFRPGRYVPPRRVGRDLTERQRTILMILGESPDGAALRDILPRLVNGATARQVREDLQVLRTLDLAGPAGRGRGARWRRT